MRFFSITLTLLINSFVNTSAFVVLSSRSFTTELQASDLKGQLSDAREQYGVQGDTPKPSLAKFLTDDNKLQQISQPRSEATDQLQSVTKQNVAAIKDSLKDISGSIKDASASIKDASASIKDAGDKVSPGIEDTLSTISKSIEYLRLELTNGSADLSTKLSGFGDKFSQLKSSSGGGGGGVGGGDLTATFNQFWDSLQIAQNGPLYLAGVAVLVAGINNRSKESEVVEAKAKATEAANAAEIAAKGASLAKELAESADAEASKKEKELEAEKKAMESEVSKLKIESAQAVEAAKKASDESRLAKLKSNTADIEGTKMASQLKIEKEMMAAKISKLEAENTKATEAAETATKGASVEKEMIERKYAEASNKVKELEADKEIMRADISKLQADISKATEASQIAAKEASIAKEMAESTDTGAGDRVKVLEAEKIKMKVEISKLQEDSIELKRVVELLMSTKQDSTKVPVAVKTATVTTKEEGAGIRKTAAELLMEETSKETKPVVKTSGGSEKNPWGSLKESTLKGRNKAQLTAYLEERSIDVAGMKKGDLISTIQNL